MASPSEHRDDVIADIERHLADHGPETWSLVRARWPQVSEASFWRYVAAAKTKVADAQILDESRRKLEARAAATMPAEKAELVSACLPVAPSPDFIAKNGERGVLQLNLLEKFDQLYADAMMLREFSITAEGRIKNPVFFGQSIGLRDRLLETVLRAAESVYSMRRQQDFWDLVIAEIAAAAPEVAQKIVDGLAALNERTGMAFARV